MPLKVPRMMARTAVALGCATLLIACAQTPLVPVDDAQSYRDRLQAIKDWRLEGRINVRVPGDSDTVRVTWENTPSEYNIRLRGALGIGTTRIRGNTEQVRMEKNGEQPVVARTAEDLLYTQLGREIPISDLHYWVRGLPAPSPKPHQVRVAAAGMLEQLEQSGWSIHYVKYMSVGPWNMPKKITAERDDLTLTLLVSEWTVDSDL